MKKYYKSGLFLGPEDRFSHDKAHMVKQFAMVPLVFYQYTCMKKTKQNEVHLCVKSQALTNEIEC